VALTLKQNVKADQAAEADGPEAIDTAISTSLRDLDFDESRLSENPLAQALERYRIHGLQN
jgi:hypothetical protein